MLHNNLHKTPEMNGEKAVIIFKLNYKNQQNYKSCWESSMHPFNKSEILLWI